LLTTKHLYQHVSVQPPKSGQAGKPAERALAIAWEDEYTQQLLLGSWFPEDPGQQPRLSRTDAGLLGLWFDLPNVQLYCAECKQDQTYSPYSAPGSRFPYAELLYPIGGSSGDTLQVFVLAYRCPLCQGAPETFLVRREGLKLTLCGRAPMAQVAVPKHIPSKKRQFYQDAVVAYECNHVLEGIFMLRVFIEQFVYDKVGQKERAVDAIDEYMASLPDDFKAHFPSVRRMYDDLSAAIHQAKAEQDLFVRVRADLDDHFERRLAHGLK
jgi:hypothetical protein